MPHISDIPDEETYPKTYPITTEVQGRLDNNFSYHPPKGQQNMKYERIRKDAKRFAEMLVTCCPPSRELSLALTDLESATSLAIAAIARNE